MLQVTVECQTWPSLCAAESHQTAPVQASHWQRMAVAEGAVPCMQRNRSVVAPYLLRTSTCMR